jgi:hypothetical protein
MSLSIVELQKRRRARGLPADAKELSMVDWLEDLQDHEGTEDFEDMWGYGLSVVTKMQEAGTRFLNGELLAYIDGIPELSPGRYEIWLAQRSQHELRPWALRRSCALRRYCRT